MDRAKYYLGFNLTPLIGPVRLRRLLEHFGDPETAWRASPEALRGAGLEEACIASLLATRERLDLDREIARIEDLGLQLLTWEDPAYPERLRHIDAPPPLLYVRGTVIPDEPMVAIVGTRHPTSYGRQVARMLARDLAQQGVTVVSGLALGIDTEAHIGALEGRGRTVAVLGSGLDQIYPLRNRDLAQRIAASGALLSDYPPGTLPEPRNFPARNRIISGLSLGVVVVEAGERSGALITCDFAAEQGRDVFAVPGSIFSPASRGCHDLIVQGARLVRGVEDLLEELRLDRAREHQEARQAVPESPIEVMLLGLLSLEPMHIDDVGAAAGLPAEVVSATLALMELRGLVRNIGGMQYVRMV
ncbi:MAG: DNA-processing protein DprA [Chloroflexia bacterium]